MEIKLRENIRKIGLRALFIITAFGAGWYGPRYITPAEEEPTEIPQAQHGVHFAQLGVPEARSFSSLNALYDKFSRDGDHLEYPMTMLCGCTHSRTQWAVAAESNADLEGKIFIVKHSPITFWNKRLWFIGEEVDAEGKPLPKPPDSGGGGY